MRHFQIRSKILNQVAVFYPKGHLDAHNVDRFEQEILKILKNKMYKIVVNCQDLSYISSAGMGIIMGYLDEIRENHGDIKLCCVNERVYEIFDLVGFTDIYDFLDGEESAVSKFDHV